MRSRPLRLGALLLLGLGARLSALDAQESPDSGPRTPDSLLTVTLITYEQGGAVYERYGHNAIWIHDAATGVDEHYDYGRFSFQQQNFLLRFIQGRMWYAMGFESDARGMVDAYVRQGRKVWMQELDIPPAERARLRAFLAWNYLPENRDYAYDYYRDNCSTRIRDALDQALGGAIRRHGAAPSGWTWRDETRRLNQHSVPLYTGLLIVLGQPVDAEMTGWEQMFLPMRLREALNRITVTGPDGVARPVVKAERLISEGGRWPAPERPSNWLPGHLIAGVLLGGVLTDVLSWHWIFLVNLPIGIVATAFVIVIGVWVIVPATAA